MTANIKSGLITTAVCVWILAGVFVGWAALLSCGGSLQPDANQVDILKLRNDIMELRTEVYFNRDNVLRTVQYRLQDAGFCLVAAESANQIRALFRKRR
ncbi:MAG: hypothetical protein KOO63_05685 [Bacteroidales bacterium]|nr:hypothetical protein [Candidatus Latescibacterota bacterium]